VLSIPPVASVDVVVLFEEKKERKTVLDTSLILFLVEMLTA